MIDDGVTKLRGHAELRQPRGVKLPFFLRFQAFGYHVLECHVILSLPYRSGSGMDHICGKRALREDGAGELPPLAGDPAMAPANCCLPR